MVTKNKTSKTDSTSKKPVTIRSAECGREFLRNLSERNVSTESVAWSVSEVDAKSCGIDGAFTVSDGSHNVSLFFDVRNYGEMPNSHPIWDEHDERSYNYDTLEAMRAFRRSVEEFAEAFEAAVQDYETMRKMRNDGSDNG